LRKLNGVWGLRPIEGHPPEFEALKLPASTAATAGSQVLYFGAGAVQGGRPLKKWKRLGLRRRIAGLTTVALAALVIVPIALAGAISSTTNPAVDNPTGTVTLCLNGGSGANNPPGAVNCNIYTAKNYVWLSGLPDSANLDPGTYFFAVLDPGGQRNPNDGTTGNLSDDTDPYTNRIFTIDANGDLSTSGNHDVAGNRIRVGVSPALVSGGPDWFQDTDNNGGVYILAVCELPDPVTDSPGVDPKVCKYDAFKISQTETTPPSSNLVVTKNAVGSFTRDYDWSVIKDQTTSSNPINSTGSSVTVAYRIKATWSGPTDTYGVAETIHVQNPNSYDVVGVEVTDNILNESSDTCTVQDGSYTDDSGQHTVSHTSGTIPAGVTVDYPYSCSYSAAPASTTETNQATATADPSNALPNDTVTGDAEFTFPDPTVTHDKTTVKDAFNGGAAQTLGEANVNGTFTKDALNNLANWASSYDSVTKTFTLTYTRSVTVVRNTCTTYNNTATVSDDATSADNSDGASVTVCGPANTGALTMGFWKNSNGQLLVVNYCKPSGKPSLVNWLSSTIGGPFAGASAYSAATCSSLYTNFILPIFNGANASIMTTMLKAQMLATALDVYFSDPNLGWVQQPSGSKTKYPSNFLPGTALGGWKMDLTAVCPMIDNLSTGTATCSLNKPSTDAVAAKAFPSSPMTMLSILQYAALAYGEAGGWYSVEAALAGLPLKTEQEVAKNVFDQFNNQLAFGSF
jgi:hypothetical protein